MSFPSPLYLPQLSQLLILDPNERKLFYSQDLNCLHKYRINVQKQFVDRIHVFYFPTSPFIPPHIIQHYIVNSYYCTRSTVDCRKLNHYIALDLISSNFSICLTNVFYLAGAQVRQNNVFVPNQAVQCQVNNPYPTQITCPSCNASVITETTYTNGGMAWLLAGGMCLAG